MKSLTKLLVSMSLILPLQGLALESKVVCEPPQGTRIDYFLFNAMNIENNKFHMGRDRISDLKPVIILHDNEKDVTLYFQKGNETPDFTPRNMKVITRNLQQVSFAGMFNGAPILASYYPLFEVLMYSQQSIWPGRDYSGARGMLFYSKCKEQE